MKTNTPKITKARLLRESEYELLPKGSLKSTFPWWLETPAVYPFDVMAVFSDGSISIQYNRKTIINKYGYMTNNDSLYVRPVLEFNDDTLVIGDKFKFADKEFEVILQGVALCTDNIGKHCFRKDWEESDANVYAKSDVKKFIDDWFKSNR